MKANPGGQLAPSDIVGRDELITRLWRVLQRQSIVLTAARRMGKTSILKKMQAENHLGTQMVYRDLEGLRTPLEFLEIILQDVDGFLSTKKRVATRARNLLTSLGGTEIKGLKLPIGLAPQWKNLLSAAMQDLAENQDSQIIFLWDEMPMMLSNIKQDLGETAAMEVLDALRAVRQTHASIRMIYTGSIGLHHVISSLKRMGYTNAPTNDMDIIDVPPLSPSNAVKLTRLLLDGENIQVQDRDALAVKIAPAVDNIPFYIHHIVDQLQWREGPIDQDTVATVVTDCLTDPQDRWDMRHYLLRLENYFGPDNCPIALHLLDALAISSVALSFQDLNNILSAQITVSDPERTRNVLVMLQRDHYVKLETDRYSFLFPLIQRWWQTNRGLAA